MKVSIVGTGPVGSTLAYTLLLKELPAELVLVDKRHEMAEGDALDLMHALLFVHHRIRVWAGDLAETSGSEVIALCASLPWKEGFQDRLEAAEANTRLFEALVPELAARSPDAKFLVVANPVDVLTWHTIRLSGFDPSRIMGSGNLVDSARFRELLSEQVGIHPSDLRAYVLGEHGETQFPAMSCAEAGGEPIEDRPDRRAMAEHAKQAGLEVFRKKGYTNYAIAMAAATVIESILADARYTLPLSVKIDGYCGVRDVCLSVPVVVGSRGVERQLKPQLNHEEQESFRRSARAVRGAIERTLPKPGA